MNAKRCSTCGRCAAVYRLWWYRFWKTGLVYCTVRVEMTEHGSGCEKWREKSPCYDLSAARFEKAESDIKRLIEYLGE